MKSHEIMTTAIECCLASDKVYTVAQRMQSENVGALPGGEVVHRVGHHAGPFRMSQRSPMSILIFFNASGSGGSSV
jgi:hypothetical protein